VGEVFPSDVFLVGGGLAALAAALAAATLLAAALGFTGLRPGTVPLSTVEEVGRADAEPLLLLDVVVVAALPPPAVVEVTVVVELFGFVVLATLGRLNEGTFGTVPVFEESLAGFAADLAVGPVEAGVLLNELVVDADEAAEPALEAEPESVEEAGLVLVVDGAGFDVTPDVDDAGLDTSLVDGAVFVLPSVVVVVGLLGDVPAAGLDEVFLGASVAEEEVTRVLEDPVFTFPDDASVFCAPTDDFRGGLEVAPGFFSVKLVSPSPPFDPPVPPAFERAPPSAGALGTVATLLVAELLDPSPLPPGGLVAVLAGVLLVGLADPDFDPGPILEPADSAPFALGLVAFDSLDLIGLFPVILLVVVLAVLEGFLAPPVSVFFSTLLFTFPFSPSATFLTSPLSFPVTASVATSVDASTEVATSELATSSELRRRFGVAGVTKREGGAMLAVPLDTISVGTSSSPVVGSDISSETITGILAACSSSSSLS